MTRRQFLRHSGTALGLGAIASLAGCTSTSVDQPSEHVSVTTTIAADAEGGLTTLTVTIRSNQTCDTALRVAKVRVTASYGGRTQSETIWIDLPHCKRGEATTAVPFTFPQQRGASVSAEATVLAAQWDES